MMGMDEGMAELVVRATEDYASLSQADLFRYTQYLNQWMWTSYNIYQRELNGYLESAEWERSGKAIILGYINNSGGRASWRLMAPMFPEEFRALVKETLGK